MMPEKKRDSEPKKLAKLCAQTADGLKADDINILEVKDLTSVTDYFVICAGGSTPHIRAISENTAEKVMEKTGRKPLTRAGTPESGWLILDYGRVMMHVFSKPAREKYDLDNLWNDAPRIVEKQKNKPIKNGQS